MEYKARHPDRVKAAEKRARDYATAEFRDVVDAAKDVPCMDCGGLYPSVCMDFDHRPGEAKVGNISKWRRTDIWGLLKEMAKCDVVCANCHRVRTTARLGRNDN